jgi:hypothetical protein
MVMVRQAQSNGGAAMMPARRRRVKPGMARAVDAAQAFQIVTRRGRR